ncbi:transcriptional activator hap3 [Savitreella phatthalungensis]
MSDQGDRDSATTSVADIPIANVLRIMKNALPDNAKIAKEAKECVQECVSEFISFITSEASEKCQQEKRKTVNGEDILFAMTSLGFENYAETLKVYLTKYREALKLEDEQNGRRLTTAGTGGEGSGARGSHGRKRKAGDDGEDEEEDEEDEDEEEDGGEANGSHDNEHGEDAGEGEDEEEEGDDGADK